MSAPDFPRGEAAILSAVGAFLRALLPAGAVVVNAQQNKVPPPLSRNHSDPLNSSRPPGWCLLTPIGPERLTQDFSGYSQDFTKRAVQHVSKFEVQIDVFGESAQEWAASAQIALRDPGFYDQFFPEGIRPIYADNPKQLNFVSDSSQFEKRWMMRAYFQYVPQLVFQSSGVTSVTVSPSSVDLIQ